MAVPLPQSYTLVAYEGDDFSFSFTWKVGESAASMQPVDLSGWEGHSQVRPGKLEEDDTDEVLIEFDVTLTAEGGVSLYADWERMSGHTEQLKKYRGRYDVQLTNPEGKPRTLLRGPFILEPETTRV